MSRRDLDYPYAEFRSEHALQESGAPELELTVVVPTLNEIDNVPVIVEALHRVLDGVVEWEVVFVDDNSADGTAEAIKSIARRDSRIRCIHRIGRRGLSSAVIEGALSGAADYIAVIDADMQHDETRLPVMLEIAKQESVDAVVGSRYTQGGGVGEWDKRRVRMSRFATELAFRVTGVKLSDPMSGFFLIRRDVFNRLVPDLSALGFKILLDLFATSKDPLTFREEPFEFRIRRHGESKLDSQAAWDFLMLLADKRFGRFVPVRFISFGLIGGTGVLVHLLVFYLFHLGLAQGFIASKIWAVGVAIISNYTLNNIITYRDRTLRGWRWFTGLLTFIAVCSLGLAADVGISSYLYFSESMSDWMQRFSIVPVIAGVIIGSVWNYAVSAVYTWRAKS